jgi:3-oxoacyl-[acyl-carrier protein] reductase
MIGFSKSLAQELAPRIRVNAIAPGYVDTDMTKDFPEKWRESLVSKIGMERFGKVEEIAQVALMMAINEYMTGTTITIDGGMVYE